MPACMNPRSTSIKRSRWLPGVILLALATMVVVVRVVFGEWFWEVQGWALLVLAAMMVLTYTIRSVGTWLGPQRGATLMLGANLGRIGIGVLAMAFVLIEHRAKFPPFCTSTMVGYMYYLVAEIFELRMDSLRD